MTPMMLPPRVMSVVAFFCTDKFVFDHQVVVAINEKIQFQVMLSLWFARGEAKLPGRLGLASRSVRS